MADIDKYHFGSYFHELLLVELNIEEEEMEAAMKNFLSETPDKTDKNENILTVSSYLHEVRHFFDCFGTFAGYSIFALSHDLTKEFVTLCLQLKENNIRWELPVIEWIKRETSPPEVKSFIKKAVTLKRGLASYKKPFEPFAKEDKNDNYIETLFLKDRGETKASPANVYSFTRDKIGHFFMPLGFETLLEGNALAVQRSYLGSFSPSSDEIYLNRISISTNGEFPIPTPYYVTDTLITKYIKKFGFEKFDRDTVLKLTDMSLSLSYIDISQVGNDFAVKIEKPDLIFLDLLETFSGSDLVSGISYPDHYKNIYENLLKQLSIIPTIGDLENEPTSPLVSIEIMGRYIAHNIIIPLIKERLNSNHNAFGTCDGFLKLFNKNIFPPFIAVPSGVKTKNVNGKIFQTWIEYIFVSKLMEQVVSNQNIILCPRANQLIPGLNNVNLSYVGNCREWIKRGCGKWYEDTFNDLPNCGFGKTLEKLSFIN